MGTDETKGGAETITKVGNAQGQEAKHPTNTQAGRRIVGRSNNGWIASEK